MRATQGGRDGAAGQADLALAAGEQAAGRRWGGARRGWRLWYRAKIRKAFGGGGGAHTSGGGSMLQECGQQWECLNQERQQLLDVVRAQQLRRGQQSARSARVSEMRLGIPGRSSGAPRGS